MHALNAAILALGLASTSSAYFIHSSCDCHVDAEGRSKVELAVNEAKEVLYYSGTVAEACSDPDGGPVHPGGWPSFQQLCENDRSSNLLQTFFHDNSEEMYARIADALLPAYEAAGTRSDQVDGSYTVVCGDGHLNRITSTTYRDRDRNNAYVGMQPPVPANQRPCDVVEALTYHTNEGLVVMLCETPYKGVSQQPTFGWMNKRSVIGKNVDFLKGSISSTMIHELIHVGDINAFPRDLGNGQSEVYLYDGCVSIAGTPESFKNCDSFAITARAMYVNNYYITDGTLNYFGRASRVPKRRANPIGFE